ncbi:NAD(P)/FAD-dependent oxidoreductase [Mycobacterium sp. CVI_P3]|uniref:NAD(P)/FAD-dependent oxidoreductase n=1 Tax=Mycobacterium pinniadriaticum TaxID=2994102 RepID=A0ABT3SDN4_9MYCO|nr:NAD(P)/FAD-dependent oxidoreductase [Mycobacterium pinniadriaticum]MCX2931148.1 NAD(P)/FAD-dependent oxidoreductase [Mycobacterium pinniadriaticum]MCX2937628.1 NAD(P)/FAD-dependent oxidoreductase [Mycobacterium pinniadriaticum]
MRAAVRRRPSPRVAIIGAGFGGLAAAVALRRIGVDDLAIIERCDGVGGTWRLNTYPGAACDIQSHLYSFSFAPNRNWSRTYARQPEILAYLESVAEDFDLSRHLLTGTAVRSLRWNADTSRWDIDLESVTTGGSFAFSADVVVSAVGLFGEPKLPQIDGLADFGASVMHTSRWDPHADFTDCRVAVIGTGASAVQVVPELAKVAAEVTIFQRTSPWMVPKDDRAFTGAELDRFRRGPWAARRERWRLWKEQHDNTALRIDDPLVAGRQGIAEEFLRRSVADDELRAALTPDYPFRCKRVLLGDDYYAALQRDNVSLVTQPIDKITETSVCTAQTVTDVDAIVLATGFQTNHYLSGIDVTGVDGQSLHQRWGEEPSAYLGVAVSGFPNFLMLYGPNTNQGGNSIVYVLEAGARLVADAVGRLGRKGGTLEVRPEAERRFNEEIAAELEQTVWTQCGSYFRSPAGRIVTQWPYTEIDYARRTWRLRTRDWIHRTNGHSPSGQVPMTSVSSRRSSS